jgi:hypothetical protein
MFDTDIFTYLFDITKLAQNDIQNITLIYGVDIFTNARGPQSRFPLPCGSFPTTYLD